MFRRCFKYIICAYVLLLNGYTQLFAHAAVNGAAQHTQVLHHAAQAKTVLLDTEKQERHLHLSVFENEEDNNPDSLKKYLTAGNYPVPVFLMQAPGIFHACAAGIFSPDRHSSSSRYIIVLQTFRI